MFYNKKKLLKKTPTVGSWNTARPAVVFRATAFSHHGRVSLSPRPSPLTTTRTPPLPSRRIRKLSNLASFKKKNNNNNTHTIE